MTGGGPGLTAGGTHRPGPAECIPAVTAELSQVRAARAAWSRIIEPGDEVAGALLAAVGPVRGLRWVQALGPDFDDQRRAVVGLCERLGLTDTRARARLGRAAARWAPRVRTLDSGRDARVLAALGGRVVIPDDDEWPTALDDLGDAAPACLWVRGEPFLGAALTHAVALVGARASTDYGDRVAIDLAAGLVARGCTTVSGGAYGIDAAVHRGTLASAGTTIAFLAGGVDRLYPAGNTDLLRAIIDEGGLVLSEVPPGSVPSRVRFLHRNRLIAAAGAATVVVEAAWRSGSLATAGRAADLGRPVGAIPGPVTSPASAGCHRLLRDGRAICVTDAAEVWELAVPVGVADGDLLAAETARDADVERRHDGLDPIALAVFDALPLRRSADVEMIVRVAGVSPEEGRGALGLLELRGLAARSGSGWVRS